MHIYKLILVVFVLVLSSCSAPKLTPNTNPWTLDNALSRVEFISVKKGTITEVHSFTELNGIVKNDGTAQINIVLDSVETNIDIRNERMREHLFNTADHPLCVLSAQIGKAEFALLNVGERKSMDVPVRIEMHGQSEQLSIPMFITRLGDNKVMVESQTPIILDIDIFGLKDGVEKLRELANLPSITPEVPVIFSLVFERA